MNLLIDNTATSTGWSNVQVVNEIPEYITNDFSGSLIFQTTSAQTAEKTFSNIDVSEYNELVINTYIIGHRQTRFYNSSDFNLAVVINGVEYSVPNYSVLAPVSIPLEGINTITSIGFRHSLTGTQNIVVSGIWAVLDELPLDIYNGMLQGMRNAVTELYGLGVRIGTVSGTAGERSITIAGNNDYVARYAVITITDGTNTEQHQLIQGNDRAHDLGQLYDGPQLLNNFTNAEVWINFPVEFGFLQEEFAAPSIHVWGFAPSPVLRDSKLEERIEAISPTAFWSKQTGQLLLYTVQIEVESRFTDLMAMMTTAVRQFLGRERIWVNGRALDFSYTTESVYTEPTSPDDIFPRVTYNLELELREEIWQRSNRPNALAGTLTVNVRQS